MLVYLGAGMAAQIAAMAGKLRNAAMASKTSCGWFYSTCCSHSAHLLFCILHVSYVISVHPQAGANANFTIPETPLAIATSRGLTTCVAYLLEVGANINVPVKKVNYFSNLC
jgi:hypothetical protein